MTPTANPSTATEPDPAARAYASTAELMSHEQWSRTRLIDYQSSKLRALVEYATARSPYYRAVFGRDAAGPDVPLRELPTLPKDTLMERFDDIVTDCRLRRSGVETCLSDPESATVPAGYRVFTTGGSTGLRGVFVYSDAEFAQWVAAAPCALATLGLTPAHRVAAIGAPSDQHITRQIFAALPRSPSGAPRLSVTTPLPDMVSTLNDYRPDALISYASVLAELAEQQLTGRLRIAPTVVGGTAEMLTPDMRERIHRAWGVWPGDGYATTEAPGIAFSCPARVGLHVREDLLILEAVDEHNQPVPVGTPSHRVLVTNLVNHSQPLIRYEVTDSVILAEGPNPTGRPFRRIAAIEGRSDDILTMPAPGGGQVAVQPFRLRAPFAALLEVRQFQLAYDEQGLHVSVVLRETAPADTPDRVRAALTTQLIEAGALPPPITVTPVPAIERESGHSAKLKLIKSRWPDAQG